MGSRIGAACASFKRHVRLSSNISPFLKNENAFQMGDVRDEGVHPWVARGLIDRQKDESAAFLNLEVCIPPPSPPTWMRRCLASAAAGEENF